MNNAILIFIGGGLGSVARYGISLLSQKFISGNFPYATLITNIISCLILIITVNFLINKPDNFIKLLVITGFCGGFSTFSTFSFETVELMRSGYMLIAILNIIVSVAACIGIIYLLSKSV